MLKLKRNKKSFYHVSSVNALVDLMKNRLAFKATQMSKIYADKERDGEDTNNLDYEGLDFVRDFLNNNIRMSQKLLTVIIDHYDTPKYYLKKSYLVRDQIIFDISTNPEGIWATGIDSILYLKDYDRMAMFCAILRHFNHPEQDYYMQDKVMFDGELLYTKGNPIYLDEDVVKFKYDVLQIESERVLTEFGKNIVEQLLDDTSVPKVSSLVFLDDWADWLDNHRLSVMLYNDTGLPKIMECL